MYSVEPIGARSRYSGSMYRSQRSHGSSTWRSLSKTLKPFLATFASFSPITAALRPRRVRVR